MTGLVAVRPIDSLIHDVRGTRVMLDSDLASLYGVTVSRLNEQVRRNRTRFPPDFMFQLTKKEDDRLRSQSATLKRGRGQHRKYLSHAFTEQGVAMLSSVLRSPRAIKVNVEIMRTFVGLRRIAATHADLARRLDALESKYEGRFKVVFEAIKQLIDPPERPRPKIGFGSVSSAEVSK